MHYVVELVSLQLFLQSLLVAEVKFNEMYALVFQKLSGTAAAYRRPSLHASSDGFLYDKRAYETTGSCNKNLHKNNPSVL